MAAQMCRMPLCYHQFCVDCLTAYVRARMTDTLVDKAYFVCVAGRAHVRTRTQLCRL
jgi:hypothetical protein